ncbi:hypothetical protein ACQ4PT_015098 [Festuca glaucescens]
MTIDSGGRRGRGADRRETSIAGCPTRRGSSAEVTSDIEVSNNNSSAQQLVPYVSTNVTTDLEVPNNNSSGMQLVPRVVIDVPSSIEVPNNNSLGLQLVEHMANNVASSIEVANNNSDPQLVPHVATKVTVVLEVHNNNSSGQQDGKNDGDLKPGALIAVADCATSITAIMFHPPSSGDPVYLVAVGIVFTAGMLAVLATLWVACDSRKRRTAKKKIMYASVAPFILGLVLNVYAYKVKK